jgi:hypothetical protein
MTRTPLGQKLVGNDGLGSRGWEAGRLPGSGEGKAEAGHFGRSPNAWKCLEMRWLASGAIRNQGRVSWGIHGLTKALLGLAMLDHSKPCGWPPLKWPYGCYRGGRP